MTPIEIALSLVMLLIADPEPAQPVLTTPVGSVAGRVYTVGRDTLPCPYANVHALGTKLGALTDTTGSPAQQH